MPASPDCSRTAYPQTSGKTRGQVASKGPAVEWAASWAQALRPAIWWRALKADAARYTWVAAAVGSNNAAGYQLATELPVMALGGFNGTDPSPTPEQFRQLVAEGRVHYFIATQIMGGNGGSDAAMEIAAWVRSTFAPSTIGGTTVYDLTQ